MLKFSKKVEYALISLLYMADKKNGELTTAREISEKFDISVELLGKILQRLSQHKLTASVQGVKGGYFLAHSADEITVRTVINAIEGNIRLLNCSEEAGCPGCHRSKICNIKSPMLNLQESIVDLFEGVTLKDFQKQLIHK